MRVARANLRIDVDMVEHFRATGLADAHQQRAAPRRQADAGAPSAATQDEVADQTLPR
jgi:hypothetical protein